MRKTRRSHTSRRQTKRSGTAVRLVCDHCGKKFTLAGMRYYCGSECARRYLSLQALFQ